MIEKLKTLIGDLIVTSTGVFTRDGYYAFTKPVCLFKVRLSTSIDNTINKRSIILVSRTNAATIADGATLTSVLLTQAARYGGASTLVNTLEWEHEEGLRFNAGDAVAIYCLSDALCCVFLYSLSLHYYEL